MDEAGIVLALIEGLHSLLDTAAAFYKSERGILDNLVTAGITLLATWVWSRVRRVRHRVSRDGPYSAVWNLRENQTIGIVTGAIQEDSAGQVPRMSSGDIKALTEVILSIRSMYPKLHYRHAFSPDFSTGELDDNLVIIGGPKWNWVSAYFFEKRQDSPVSFDEYDIVVHGEAEDDVFSASVEGEVITRDVGVICRLPHPDAADKAVFMFAGCHTYGVLAAVRYVSYAKPYSLGNVRDLARRVERHWILRLTRSVLGRYRQHYFIAVVEVEVRGDSIGSPRLVHFSELRPDMWERTGAA